MKKVVITFLHAVSRDGAIVSIKEQYTSTPSGTFPQVLKVGRDQRSHIRLTEEGVSRMHTVLEVRSNGDVEAIDLGSGISINDLSINKGPLKVGDKLQVGAAILFLDHVSIVDAPVEAPVEAPKPVSAARNPYLSPPPATTPQAAQEPKESRSAVDTVQAAFDKVAEGVGKAVLTSEKAVSGFFRRGVALVVRKALKIEAEDRRK